MTKIYSPAGVNVSNVATTQEWELGTKARGEGGSEWVYIKAGSAVTAFMCVGITKAYAAHPVTKALVDAGSMIGVAQVAFAINEYGWVATKGGNDHLRVRAKNACAISVALYTTATAGYLDDTAASQTLVNGIVLTDTATSSGAAEECLISTNLFPTPTI